MTGVISKHSVEVNRVAQHVSDVRPVVVEPDEPIDSNCEVAKERMRADDVVG